MGESAGGVPFDWPMALAEVLTPEQSKALEAGSKKWGDLLPEAQSRVILRIAETIHARLGDMSQSIYNRYKPHWASSVTSWTKTANMEWQSVLNHLHVHPSSLPISARIGRFDTGA